MIRTVSDQSAPPVAMEVASDPFESDRLREQFVQLRRNADWLQAHAHDVYSQNRGRFVSIAGQEAFAAETAEAARAAGEAKHPDDHGSFVQFVPAEKRAHI